MISFQRPCNIETNTTGLFEVKIQVTNAANHTTELIHNITYYGTMTPVISRGQNISLHSNNTIKVSEYSKFSCVSNHPVAYTANMTFISGNYTTIGSIVNWINGTASLSCVISDTLGNTWQGNWNINHVTNDINIQHEILNNSGHITKLGAPN